MASRALIIAIENYADVAGGGMAKTLPGTLQAGLRFRDWLLSKWQRELPNDANPQLILCSEPVQPDGLSATSKEIRKALLKLKDVGQSTTEELYVFFSGHGFSFLDKPGSRSDILVTSDFEQPALSSDCCLNLDEMVLWLSNHLGPGRHYYFIDSCRNPLTTKEIQISKLLPFDPQASGIASTFLLQSTVEDATAAVGGPFPAALIDGLQGRGRAKTWDPKIKDDEMCVRYDTLRNYLKRVVPADQGITSKTAGAEGESDAILAHLRPIPLSKFTVKINSPAPVKGEISYRRGRSKGDERQSLTGNVLTLEFEPDDYTVVVSLESGPVSPSGPILVDLWEDQTLEFLSVKDLELLKNAAPLQAPGLAAAASAEVDFVVPGQTTLDVRNVFTGEVMRIENSERKSLPAGRYLATMGSTTAHKIVRQEIELTPGQAKSVSLGEWQNSAPHWAIANQLPAGAVRSDGVDFSESLGAPVSDPDLDLWLALVGGGRILGSRGEYSKLAAFPLHDFSNEQPGASPVYVLAGFEDVGTRLSVGLSGDAAVPWRMAAEPRRPHGMPEPLVMAGIREAFLPAAAGSALLSLRVNDQPSYTVATLASPNRCTLITMTLDEEGNPRLGQYLLPFGHLIDQLPPQIAANIRPRNQLRDVYSIAQASRVFRKRRDIRADVPMFELMELFYAKWVDPIGSALLAYEALRRGHRAELPVVVTNMKRFFGDLPDTFCLARLAGEEVSRPSSPPLFFDGLRAFPDYPSRLPLPASHLDFTSLWTAWRAAVE
jgi:Caspase domain